jgi:hypothetical protein
MKKLLIAALFAGLLAGCGINKQVKLIKAFENCTYEIVSADSVYLAHTDVTGVVNSGQFDAGRLPGLALAYLRKDIPLEAKINLRIDNPSPDDAAINQFEYRLLIGDQEIASGFVNRKVEVTAGGGSAVVPVYLNANVYSFLSNGRTMSEISAFITGGRSGGAEKKSMITIKFKPSIQSGSTLVKYPGWITINKEVSSKILF